MDLSKLRGIVGVVGQQPYRAQRVGVDGAEVLSINLQIRGCAMKIYLFTVLSMLLAGGVHAQSTEARAATPQEESAVTAALKDSLKDPDSAKVSGVKISADGKTACGFVNAKNSFGGYTGNSAFYAMGFKNKSGEPVFAIVGVDSGGLTASAEMCAKDGVRL